MKIIFYRHNKNNAALHLSAHTISFNELTFVLKGELIYYSDGNEIRLREGDAIYLKSGSLRARNESKGSADYISFNFTGNMENLPVKITGAGSYDIKFLLFYCDARYNDLEREAFSELEPILRCIIKRLENLKPESVSDPVNNIKKYVKEHITEKLTLNDISKQEFISESYMSFLFKKETGKTLIDYALNEKMEKAKTLLIEGVLPLTEIAAKTGFSDYNYFIRTFKKRVGTTPLQFRKTYINYTK